MILLILLVLSYLLPEVEIYFVNLIPILGKIAVFPAKEIGVQEVIDSSSTSHFHRGSGRCEQVV